MESPETLNTYITFENSPEKLFSISSKFFRESKFEAGINALESALKFAQKKEQENSPELAIFYRKYGDGIVTKIMSSNEILNLNENDVGKEDKESKVKDHTKAIENPIYCIGCFAR